MLAVPDPQSPSFSNTSQGVRSVMADNLPPSDAAELPPMFRLMAERIPGVVWAIDANLRFTALFGAGLAQLGQTSEQFTGTTLYQYFDTDDPEFPPIAHHLRALQGDSVDYEITWRERHFQVHLEPVIDKEKAILGCVGFGQDVTDRKRADAELRQRDQMAADRKLVSTLESVPEGVFVVDREWRFKYVSHAAARIWKMLPEQVVGRLIQEVFPETEQIIAVSQLARAVEENVPVHMEGFYPDPLNIYYECYCHPTPDGLLVYLRDVTQRKRSQEALQREQRALWRMVQASDHERQLITHDLHDGAAQELMGALMFFETFEDQWSVSPAEAKMSADAGIAALKRASTEVRRLITGVRTPVLDRLGIVSAIEDLAHQLQFPHSPKIEFQRNMANIRFASVLENCLYRIAQELVTNACKHSRSTKVRVLLRKFDGHLMLKVRDWGIGFDPKCISEERFGLEGVRERTRILGGKLRIRSQPGEGTTVRVTLPIVEQPEEE